MSDHIFGDLLSHLVSSREKSFRLQFSYPSQTQVSNQTSGKTDSRTWHKGTSYKHSESLFILYATQLTM